MTVTRTSPVVRLLCSATLRVVLTSLVAAVSATAAQPVSGAVTRPAANADQSGRSMKELRRAANERTRRVIFNNDGDEPFHIANPTVEDLLNLRTSALPGTHVDSIFFCAHTSFGTFKRFTKVGQMFTLQEGHYAANKLPELIRKNIDPLRVMLE